MRGKPILRPNTPLHVQTNADAHMHTSMKTTCRHKCLRPSFMLAMNLHMHTGAMGRSGSRADMCRPVRAGLHASVCACCVRYMHTHKCYMMLHAHILKTMPYTNAHVCTQAHLCTHTRTHTHARSCVCTYMHPCIMQHHAHTCLHACMHEYITLRTYVQITQKQMQTCRHVALVNACRV